jgi:hypothetical protein
MGTSNHGLLSDMYDLKDDGKLSSSPPTRGLMGNSMMRGSLSNSLNGGLTGSFDSAGRRWSRTHNEKR